MIHIQLLKRRLQCDRTNREWLLQVTLAHVGAIFSVLLFTFFLVDALILEAGSFFILDSVVVRCSH